MSINVVISDLKSSVVGHFRIIFVGEVSQGEVAQESVIEVYKQTFDVKGKVHNINIILIPC